MSQANHADIILGLVPRICNLLILLNVILGTRPGMTSRGCALYHRAQGDCSPTLKVLPFLMIDSNRS